MTLYSWIARDDLLHGMSGINLIIIKQMLIGMLR